MKLKQLTNKIFYYPHQPETDRPMLAYINGDNIKLVIDAGNSSQHVTEFYNALKSTNLQKPNLTTITHWHWDHTFGMSHIHGLSIAHTQTNKLLQIEKNKLTDFAYLRFLREDAECFAKEYSINQEVNVVMSDIEFDFELILNLGGLTAKLFHTDSPHSKDTVLIYILEEKVLFLGDSTSEDFFDNSYMDFDK